MNEFLTKSGRLPTNLDIEDIFIGVQGNKTKIKYLKDGMIYFISLLTIDNDDKSKDGYITLNEEILSQIIGDKRPSGIVKKLLEKGVIEILHHRKGRSSRKYRLTERYKTGEFKYVELSERIKNKIQQHRQHKYVESNDIIKYKRLLHRQFNELSKIELEQKYSYIFDQFRENDLTIDTIDGELFIKNIGTKLFERTILLTKNRGFVLKSVFNYIGQMMNQVEDLDKKRYNLSLSSSNLRFHSNLTSLPRVLRPFLKINGQSIGEVDISSSQPYILSTILNQEFITSQKDGYNIHTIHNNLHKDLISTKSIIPSNKKGNNNYVLGVHMNDDECDGLFKFTQIDFSQDFYQHILCEGIRLYPEYLKSRKKFREGRSYIKKHIMNFLFERREFFREENEVIILLDLMNPSLCNYIDRFNQIYGTRDFSILLQRTESFLMLENVCRKIHTEFPEIPFYTIHDSILTTQSNLDIVINTMNDTILEITGKPLRVKSKKYDQSTNISDEVFNETWDKVKISSKEKYQKMRSYFLQVNINKGMNLLLTKEEQEEWSEIMRKEIERDL